MSTHTSHAVVDESGAPPHIHHMDHVTAYSAAKFGMWLFLATEILLFAVMFTAFAIFRYMNLHEFHQASHHLNWKLGALNTLILLFSSLTAALAVDAAQRGNKAALIRNLVITILCGFGFLVVKTVEYTQKYTDGLFPRAWAGTAISQTGADSFWGDPQAYKMFYGLYFCMTGIHGLHVVIGMALLAWVLVKAMKGRFSERYFTPVEVSALYWHLVDLIWIYLFPLLYLVG